MRKQLSTVTAYSVVLTTVVLHAGLVQAVEIPTTATPINRAPYSKVFFTGSAYAVKDHDFKGDDPSIGFSTVWIENPTKDLFHVGVRYCLPNDSLADSGTSLSSVVLLNKNQPLLKIDQLIKATSVQQKVLSPGYFTTGLGDPFWDNDVFYNGVDPFWGDWDDFDGPVGFGAAYVPPTAYVPANTCSAGSSRFDISQLAGAIAQLPPQTLQVKLVFSNGETSQWRLGDRTVKALKELLTLRQTQTNPAKPPLSN